MWIATRDAALSGLSCSSAMETLRAQFPKASVDMLGMVSVGQLVANVVAVMISVLNDALDLHVIGANDAAFDWLSHALCI